MAFYGALRHAARLTGTPDVRRVRRKAGAVQRGVSSFSQLFNGVAPGGRY